MLADMLKDKVKELEDINSRKNEDCMNFNVQDELTMKVIKKEEGNNNER